jgi:hypothetical protein
MGVQEDGGSAVGWWNSGGWMEYLRMDGVLEDGWSAGG